MKRSIVLMVFVCLLAVAAAAQVHPERRVIEVSGSAEQYVTPNEFTFKITLAERIENKQKITIEQQEANLRTELTKLGVDVAKDLSIYDISSTYFRQKKVKDVLGTKDYRLRIRDLNMIAQLQDLADRINVSKLDLIDTDHSDISELRKQTKIEAVKAAKRKAEYLLSAIGQKTGSAVYIKEVEEESPGYNYSNSNSNVTANYSSNIRVARGVVNTDDGLSFAPIKLRYVITAKFEIE
jgi:uncharacterized protein YggE